jgi:hypothetical protein
MTPTRLQALPNWHQRFIEELSGPVLDSDTPRAVVHVLGWSVVCDPPEQTAAKIQEALTLSAGSVSAPVLVDSEMLERVARPGQRHVYYRLRQGVGGGSSSHAFAPCSDYARWPIGPSSPVVVKPTIGSLRCAAPTRSSRLNSGCCSKILRRHDEPQTLSIRPTPITAAPMAVVSPPKTAATTGRHAMTIHGEFVKDSTPRERRRWLLGLDPIFEGGWLHKGKRAQQWDVESELMAVSLLGDVTVDLSDTKSAPAQVVIKAFALGRDVDVYVAPGTHVELSGPRLGHLRNHVAADEATQGERSVRIEGHAFLGDVTVQIAPTRR